MKTIAAFICAVCIGCTPTPPPRPNAFDLPHDQLAKSLSDRSSIRFEYENTTPDAHIYRTADLPMKLRFSLDPNGKNQAVGFAVDTKKMLDGSDAVLMGRAAVLSQTVMSLADILDPSLSNQLNDFSEQAIACVTTNKLAGAISGDIASGVVARDPRTSTVWIGFIRK